MFRIKDNAITPFRGMFEQAEKCFDGAHIHAQREGAAHLHAHMAEAAEQAGLPTRPLGVHWEKGEAYVGIARTPEGDQLADAEYGTPETTPAPVLRAAHRQAMSEAKARYAYALVTELGF